MGRLGRRILGHLVGELGGLGSVIERRGEPAFQTSLHSATRGVGSGITKAGSGPLETQNAALAAGGSAPAPDGAIAAKAHGRQGMGGGGAARYDADVEESGSGPSCGDTEGAEDIGIERLPRWPMAIPFAGFAAHPRGIVVQVGAGAAALAPPGRLAQQSR